MHSSGPLAQVVRTDDSQLEEVNTPESYDTYLTYVITACTNMCTYSAITALPNMLDDFFQELAHRTRWIFTVLAGVGLHTVTIPHGIYGPIVRLPYPCC